MNWFTVKDSKVVYVPMTVHGKDGGEDTKKFIRTGIRINMVDGSWWFLPFGRKTITQHYPRVQTLTHWGAPAFEFGTQNPILTPERVERYASFEKLVESWGTRNPKLIVAIMEGRDQALEDEEEKRAASRS